jgi:hypothetical protein
VTHACRPSDLIQKRVSKGVHQVVCTLESDMAVVLYEGTWEEVRKVAKDLSERLDHLLGRVF